MLDSLMLSAVSAKRSALLGYGAQRTAYYIRCHECHALWDQDPAAWKAWEEEMAETQQKFEAAVKAEQGE